MHPGGNYQLRIIPQRLSKAISCNCIDKLYTVIQLTRLTSVLENNSKLGS